MTLPTPDAQSSWFQSHRTPMVPNPTNPTPLPIYSIPTSPLTAPEPSMLPPSLPQTELPDESVRDRAIDFASHSWDLATGGLKTLTAKRELPSLVERRSTELLTDQQLVPRSYTFLLIILACVVIMLISGGVALFVMLQP